jgi:hypothetical protein
MDKCVIIGCSNKVVGGWEHHVYSIPTPDVAPTIVDRRIIRWCQEHEGSMPLKHPGRSLTQKELEG